MKLRSLSFASGLVLSAAVIGSIALTPAAAKRPKPPPPPPPPPPSFSTYVKNYASVIDGAKCDMTPEAVQVTSDGGSVALALSSTSSVYSPYSCAGANWLVKLDSFGTPQWQVRAGCVDLPPGSYAYGVSLQQTADGGYVLGGGTIGCGSETLCPYLGGRQCGLVEKLDATGRLVWAQVYSSGGDDRENSINRIRQTSDGGFVVAGSFRDADSNIGAWILKLDSGGAVQWQRKLGPGGPSGPGRMHVYFNAVQPTADGGYIATGEFYSYARSSAGDTGVLVVKLDANGNVEWQRGFNSFDSSGAPTASEHAFSIIQSSEGGYVVAGNWGTATGPGTCCVGALLLKLDANGAVQWQKAYHAGVHCFNSYNTACHAIGPIAYSLRQTSDGGYALAGATNLKTSYGAPMVPWLAKTDASGNLLWQHVYYQGGTLSQYFASSDLTSSGGHLALGFTSNPTDFIGELFAVKTDSAGLVGSCSQVQPATPLTTIDPGLTTIAPALPVQTTSAVQDNSPSTTQPTSVSSTPGQC
jgi:hypothetical protein